MKNDNKQLLMVGLPGTGKTTYLAALWYVVNNSKEIEGALGLDCLPENSKYLNMISKEWIAYSEVGRTAGGSETVVSMTLRNVLDNSLIEIFIPDVSGEVFREQIEKRHCTVDFYQNIEESCGIMFFINCGDIKPVQTINNAEKLIQILQDHPSDIRNNIEETPVEWDPSLMPTQVKLIELLQFILDAPSPPKPYKISIILSAWDLIAKLNITPRDFLKTRLPMFAHFIEANNEIITTKCYGISAQGCPYDDDEERTNLARKIHSLPSKKILVQIEDSTHRDITEPIKWLMES